MEQHMKSMATKGEVESIAERVEELSMKIEEKEQEIMPDEENKGNNETIQKIVESKISGREEEMNDR